MTVVVVATEPSTRYMTATCTLTASAGSVPARISPTMAPGRKTMPTALVVSICGMSAVRSAAAEMGGEGVGARQAQRQPALDEVAVVVDLVVHPAGHQRGGRQ